MTQAPISNTSPLTGQPLLDRYNTLRAAGMSHGDIAVEAGYYIKVEDGPKAGEIRSSGAKLNAALLRAQGIDVPDAASRGGQRKGGGWNKVVVNSQGRASLSQAMIKQMGAQRGDHLELIEANGDGITLKLVKADALINMPALTAV